MFVVAQSLDTRLQQALSDNKQLLQQHELQQQSLAAEHVRNLESIRSDFDTAALAGVSLSTTSDKALRIQVASDLLFAIGRSSVNPNGESLLLRIADILVQHNENLDIRITGHSDNTPLGSRLERLFTNNWGLSLARAISAARFFGTQTNLNPHLISVVGMGDTQPIASNSTPAGRGKNRRIEILLLPLTSETRTQ